MTDTIANFISQLKTGFKNKDKTIIVPNNLKVVRILDILVQEGYIRYYRKHPSGEKAKEIISNPNGYVVIYLKYDLFGQPTIQLFSKISKPGSRKYINVSELRSSHNWRATKIVSTSKGILSDRKAIEANAGGEYIALIN